MFTSLSIVSYSCVDNWNIIVSIIFSFIIDTCYRYKRERYSSTVSIPRILPHCFTPLPPITCIDIDRIDTRVLSIVCTASLNLIHTEVCMSISIVNAFAPDVIVVRIDRIESRTANSTALLHTFDHPPPSLLVQYSSMHSRTRGRYWSTVGVLWIPVHLSL